MKINGISLEDHGSGYLVTVRFFVGRSEELEPGDIARLVDVANEAAGSRDPSAVEKTMESALHAAAEKSVSPPVVDNGDGTTSPIPSRRRREARPTQAETKSEGMPAPREDAAPQSRTRRSRAPIAGTAPTTVSPSSKITNADLAKACSEAARVLTPKGVLEILAENKWASTNDIPDDRRRSFLARLEGAVSRAGK